MTFFDADPAGVSPAAPKLIPSIAEIKMGLTASVPRQPEPPDDIQPSSPSNAFIASHFQEGNVHRAHQPHRHRSAAPRRSPALRRIRRDLAPSRRHPQPVSPHGAFVGYRTPLLLRRAHGVP